MSRPRTPRDETKYLTISLISGAFLVLSSAGFFFTVNDSFGVAMAGVMLLCGLVILMAAPRDYCKRIRRRQDRPSPGSR